MDVIFSSATKKGIYKFFGVYALVRTGSVKPVVRDNGCSLL